MEPVIQTHDLTKTYPGVNALQALNLNVTEHSIFGFLGPNGAGKTTTIKLMLGLAQPTSGSATVFGLDIIKDTIEIRKRVGYLAQDPRFYSHMTARETLNFTAHFFYSGPKAAIDERVSQTLELVGLSEVADRPLRTYSGGERQRLGIAQAQVNYPDLLILDEPAASLDPMGRHDVLEVMERLRKHTTIFYSTHILDDVQRVSDTVAILNHGELIAQAPITELLADSGEVVYDVELKGDSLAARARLNDLPWVCAVQETAGDGKVEWKVSVKDAAAAEEGLLAAILAGGGVTVTAFGKKAHNLEDVFVNLIEGDEDER
jgi:ABC-2 type transport system ATP-binding protein